MSEKTYRIGEAAALLDLKTYVLRFWETEFPQLEPLRTEKGQRLYTEKHVIMLRAIKSLLHDRGMTIDGARRYLAKNGPDSVESSPFMPSQSFALDDHTHSSVFSPAWETSRLDGEADVPPSLSAESAVGDARRCDKTRSPGLRLKVIAELEAIRDILNSVSRNSQN